MKIEYLIIFILSIFILLSWWLTTTLFNSKDNLFDIVIPVGPNDFEVIGLQLEYTRKNIIGYRNIYLICSDDTLKIDGCITISENIFPFSLNTVSEHLGKSKRNGWYLQQLLKLYSGLIIPGILDKYLVIDADTFFLKPTVFYENNKSIYNYSTENHLPYFTHIEKLHPNLRKIYHNRSGICHHMMFETRYIKQMFNMIEQEHNDIFYKIFLKNVTEKEGSGASEYELYFNYMLLKHPEEITIRKLNFKNADKLIIDSNDYDYISYHHYLR
jgi:hypothetical protein